MDVAKKQSTKKRGITIITTHINADFDALASMLAAQKLYPEALVVFPGSQEKNLRNFFINSMVYLFNMADMKDIDLSSIKKLVLVDTRQPSRIGKLSDVLTRPDLEIHIFDHHPPMDNDIRGHYEAIQPTGATVSILTEMILAKGIDISPDEATIMSLGIYEDTGSFTFSSTTEKDFKAAAELLSKGANLNIISNLIAREISPEQIGLLNDMIQATTNYTINGIEIIITSVTTDNYVPDFAFLVHKMVKMENLNAIFALARMEDKVYIVARSRIPEVDVGAIVTPFGGGGHNFAAAATIKGMTLVQAEQQLLEILYKNIRSRRLAKDLMSAPAITVGADVSCKEAGNLLTRYNINALLVAEKNPGKDRLLGLISRQVIEKALYHQLDHVSVREYMTSEIAFVGPDADLSEIQEKIIENKQRILPVIDKAVIIGVVTRTDLLNVLVRQSQRAAEVSLDPMKEPLRARTRNIAKFMKERLSDRLLGVLKDIGEVAAELGVGAFVAGGFVRDLFLYRPNEDLDIVIEGDGIEFARKYAKMVGARIHSYRKFGTAVIIFPDGFKIDVASARMEYYKFPAALPIVEMSSIKLDLYRRDFTINTLAIQLNPGKFGTLIDFFSAQKDIKAKAVRVLHNLSFVEDPTRVFRAIRFEQRFGFAIGKLTSSLIENAVKMDFFKSLSGRRVFAELRLILAEENPTPSIVRLNEYNLLNVIHPRIRFDKELVDLFNSVKKAISWHDLLFLEESYMKWAVYFMALIRNFDRKTSEAVCLRFELAPRYQQFFCKDRMEANRCLKWLEQRKSISNSLLYQKLCGFKVELILYMMAATRYERVKKHISYFYTHLRPVQISITGKELKEMGLEPGPIYREILYAVRYARLNGQLKSRSDEIEFVKDYVQ
ncbi:MAG: CBS domain-containing protein [Desulfobacterales bacterium]|nr:CBS domain-containing protein [Desulfobacterales bacterium]